MCAQCPRPRPDRPVGVAARAMLVLIGLYRLTLSPFLGQWCRYLPTCSAYGEAAIRRHGAWAGGWMTLARLMRCNPLGASGYDPVPEQVATGARWWTPWRYGRWTGRHIDPATRLDGPGRA
jgi:putative membrane protein insertion efficiency factor